MSPDLATRRARTARPSDAFRFHRALVVRHRLCSNTLVRDGEEQSESAYDRAVAGEYTIAGGLADAQRLARQAHVMAAATEAFLSRLGLAPGWACLDVGCGGGQVTVAMARIAGPSGRAVGVDVDVEVLELARQAAKRAGVKAEFLRADAVRPISGEAFDLAYARLLLSHLVDPAAAVRAMRKEVRPGGTVAVEDLFTGTLRSEPPASALDRLQEVYCATVRFHGGDPTIGPRLRALLSATGLEDLHEETVSNPMETVEEKLFLAQLVGNMRASILEAEAATAEQIDELEASVAEAARDPTTVFYQARIHQVSGRRPA
jgi:ubiquinone/menaquinone biosynthesis C-methylase UbiE